MAAEEIVAAVARAWNAGDGAAMAAYFAEDAVFTDVVGRVQRGRATIAAEHQKIFDTIYRGSSNELCVVESRELAEGVLVLNTASTLRAPAGPRAGVTGAVQTMVVSGGQIVAFQNTIKADLAAFAERDEDLASRKPAGWADEEQG